MYNVSQAAHLATLNQKYGHISSHTPLKVMDSSFLNSITLADICRIKSVAWCLFVYGHSVLMFLEQVRTESTLFYAKICCLPYVVQTVEYVGL
jgi:hypothetical protein